MTWNASLIDGPISDADGGYLLNIAPELMASDLAAYVVTPTPVTPDRVWAGDTGPSYPATVFLRFPDEATARGTSLGAQWTD
jgi:hypothetical protein